MVWVLLKGGGQVRENETAKKRKQQVQVASSLNNHLPPPPPLHLHLALSHKAFGVGLLRLIPQRGGKEREAMSGMKGRQKGSGKALGEEAWRGEEWEEGKKVEHSAFLHPQGKARRAGGSRPQGPRGQHNE